jgi:hypothetical protein
MEQEVVGSLYIVRFCRTELENHPSSTHIDTFGFRDVVTGLHESHGMYIQTRTHGSLLS